MYMCNVISFDKIKAKAETDFEEMDKQANEAIDKFEALYNQKNLKLNNGKGLTDEDINEIFAGMAAMAKANRKMVDDLKEKGIWDRDETLKEVEREYHLSGKIFDEKNV